MGVYIKQMEMPESCYRCPFCGNGVLFMYKCDLVKDSDFEFINDSRKNFCPLVEVKEPHGRLIDGDELLKTIRTHPKSTTREKWGIEDAKGFVHYALKHRTVIESEPEEIEEEEHHG